MIEIITEDLVIVGAGPAGFSAAIYAKQAGFDALVLKSMDPSLIATTDLVNNYLGFGEIGGSKLYQYMESHYKAICGDNRLSSFEVVELRHREDGTFLLLSSDGRELGAKAVIWAAGAKPRKLSIPGEDEIDSISYCATCDGSFYEGDPHLLVVGGGDSAVEEALYLAELVDKVTLLVRNDLSAKAELQDRLRAHPRVEIITGAKPISIRDAGGMLGGAIVEVEGSSDLKVSGVFVAIGHVPNSQPIDGSTVAIIDGSGFAVRSNADGFFIAGDINGRNQRQAIIAAGDGARAGIEASDYLRSQGVR